MIDFETWWHDLDEGTQFAIEYEWNDYKCTFKGQIVEIIEIPNDILLVIENSITRKYIKLSKIKYMEEII